MPTLKAYFGDISCFARIMTIDHNWYRTINTGTLTKPFNNSLLNDISTILLASLLFKIWRFFTGSFFKHCNFGTNGSCFPSVQFNVMPASHSVAGGMNQCSPIVSPLGSSLEPTSSIRPAAAAAHVWADSLRRTCVLLDGTVVDDGQRVGLCNVDTAVRGVTNRHTVQPRRHADTLNGRVHLTGTRSGQVRSGQVTAGLNGQQTYEPKQGYIVRTQN